MGDTPSFDPQAFKDFEHAGWERSAANYHDLFGAITVQAAGPLLDAVDAKAGTRLLDVACGAGQISGKSASPTSVTANASLSCGGENAARMDSVLPRASIRYQPCDFKNTAFRP